MQPNYAPTYPPQYPQPQQFPQQAPPQPPAQFAPQFPQQAYPQQFAPQIPPAQPLAQGTIDDFYNQPSAGGSPALKFPDRAYGTVYVGIVERPLANGDIQQQTDIQNRPLFFKDGRPKFVMRVPLQMQPQANHPDGRGTWFVKGGDREELARAMAEAGAPEGPPEHRAVIQITYTQDQQSGAGMNPRKVKQVAYTRPDGAAPVVPAAPSPAAVALQQAQQVAAAQPVAQPIPQQAPQPVYAEQVNKLDGGLVPEQPGGHATPQQPPAAPAPVAAPQPPAGLSQAQQELLAKLGG
jgi:hypothetical protein